MILDTINCTVYGNPSITYSLDMEERKASNGKPAWVDYGAASETDNMTVTCIVTAKYANRLTLENIVRKSYDSKDSIDVEFENGELLFDFAGKFTIQSYTLIKKPSQWVEYGFKVVFAMATYINPLTLGGIRATTCGNFLYSTANIDQPLQFKQKHYTHKYTGMLHGSSYSAELPTIEYDSTSWKSTAVADSMRKMWDALITDRGEAFFVTFPANSYPFGIQTGAAQRQIICMTARNAYTFKRVNGHIWSVDLAVYEFVKAGAIEGFSEVVVLDYRASDDSISAWTKSSDFHIATYATSPYTDTERMFHSGIGETSSLAQSLIIDPLASSVSVTFWHGGWTNGDDAGRVAVTFRDASLADISTEVTAYYNPRVDGYDEMIRNNGNWRYWKHRTLDFDIPEGTTSMWLDFQGIRNDGTNLDFYIDGVEVALGII